MDRRNKENVSVDFIVKKICHEGHQIIQTQTFNNINKNYFLINKPAKVLKLSISHQVQKKYFVEIKKVQKYMFIAHHLNG